MEQSPSRSCELWIGQQLQEYLWSLMLQRLWTSQADQLPVHQPTSTSTSKYSAYYVILWQCCCPLSFQHMHFEYPPISYNISFRMPLSTSRQHKAARRVTRKPPADQSLVLMVNSLLLQNILISILNLWLARLARILQSLTFVCNLPR